MTRTAAHVALAGIDLDRHSAVPLSIQIYEGLRRAILRGSSGPGNSAAFDEISLSKLNANIKPESLVRIAFDVTDTRQKWDLWPPGANLQKPAAWGEALIKAATHN